MLLALIIRADGALAETEDLRLQVFQQVFEEAGFPWRADRNQFFETAKLGGCMARITHLLRQTVRWRAETADMTPLIAAMHRRANKLFTEKLENARLVSRPGMPDLITAARRDGLKIALAATMQEDAARILVNKTLGPQGLGWFDVIAARNDEHSDDATFYRQVLTTLGLEPGNCLVIESTVSGARAARSIGLAAITTRSSTCMESYGEDGDPLVIEDLPSLIANTDKRRLDPLTPDERAELLSVLNRLQAGNVDTAAKLNRSSAMRVSDILKAKGSAVKTIEPQTSIRALARALRTESVGVMVVVDSTGVLKGIISERDLARGLAEFGNDLSSMSVSDLMTTAVVTCAPEDGVANIARIMTQRRIRHLPVMSGHKLTGLVSIGDVLKHRLDEVQLEANVLRDVAIARK